MKHEASSQYPATGPYPQTPWSRAYLEKLTVAKQVKKFPAFYGTRRFIAVFTIAHS
jgi:hypothetical protein